MSKFRAILLVMALTTLAFGTNAMAESGGKAITPGTDTVSFLHAKGTPKQTAVFAAFLSRLVKTATTAGVDTAISVSNILGAVPATKPAAAGGTNDLFEVLRGFNDKTGTIEFYLFDKDGTLIFFETGAGSPGRGLSAAGTLGPGQTYTVLLEEILGVATGNPNKEFTGYGWIVANFDGVQGTYNVTIFGVGFTQAFHLEPTMGVGNTFFGGIPVFVP